MKLFLSIPISGKEDTLLERYNNALELIFKHFPEYEVICQSNLEELARDKKSVPESEFPYYMGKDIQSVLESDLLFLGSGWEMSKGCLLEFRAAELFGKKIISQNSIEN